MELEMVSLLVKLLLLTPLLQHQPHLLQDLMPLQSPLLLLELQLPPPLLAVLLVEDLPVELEMLLLTLLLVEDLPFPLQKRLMQSEMLLPPPLLRVFLWRLSVELQDVEIELRQCR